MGEILYPKNKRQGFDGGKNSKFDKHILADNESPDCANVIFENGDVATRLGTAKFNSTSVGTFAGHGLYTRNDRSGSQTMIAWFNGTAYYNSGTTFVTIPSAQSIFTAGVRVGAAEQENYIYFGNGTTPYKYNGDFTRHGVPAPTTTATVVSAAAGTITGGYNYVVTYVNSALVEGDISPISSTFTAASATLGVSAIPTAPVSFGVIRRNVYRNKLSGTTYFRVTQIADNSTTSITDNKTDAELGVEAPSDNGEPPNYSTIIYHQGRLFCNDTADPSAVWYSELNNPYIFKTTNFEFVGDDSGDRVKAFAIHDNGLIVYTDRSSYMIYMESPDPTTWEVVKLRSPYGSRSPFGGFSYNNKQMFPAMQNNKLAGFAAISGNAVDPEATLLTVSAAGADTKSDRIEPDVFNIQNAHVDRISSIVYKNVAYISVTYGDGNTTNNRIYRFDFSISNLSKKQEASWVPWTGLNAEQFTEYSGAIYYISSTATGHIYELNKASTYSDDGVAINSYFWTKEFSGIAGDEKVTKDFRFTYLLYENAGDFDMDLNYRVNSEIGDGSVKRINLDPGGSLWGTMIWGRDNWGGGNTEGEMRIPLGQLRGERIQFRFSNQNTINQRFRIIGLQFEYNRKGRR